MPPTAPAIPDPIIGRHLGRKKPTPDQLRKVVPLAPFLKRMGATPPPDEVDYVTKASKTLDTMLGNDQYGDCTIAAVLHQEGAQTAQQPGGAERVPTDKEAYQQYVRVCGPGDQGCYIPEVLQYQRDKGVQCGGKIVKSDGFVSCTLGDQLLAKVATYLFGGLHLGINLPRQWYMNGDDDFVWDVTNTDIVGGHSVAVVGYDKTGLRISTWGNVGIMTWKAFSDSRWVEEVYATLSPDWYSAQGLDAHGVNVTDLKKALDVVKGGGTPDIPPTPTPVPPVPPIPPTPGGGSLTATGTLDFFGQKLPMELVGAVSDGKEISAGSILDIIADFSMIRDALKNRDMLALARAVQKLMSDLGFVLSPADASEFGKLFLTEVEARILD